MVEMYYIILEIYLGTGGTYQVVGYIGQFKLSTSSNTIKIFEKQAQTAK